jgi:hypothetical protein
VSAHFQKIMMCHNIQVLVFVCVMKWCIATNSKKKSIIIPSLDTSTAGVEVDVNDKQADGEEHSASMTPPPQMFRSNSIYDTFLVLAYCWSILPIIILASRLILPILFVLKAKLAGEESCRFTILVSTGIWRQPNFSNFCGQLYPTIPICQNLIVAVSSNPICQISVSSHFPPPKFVKPL